MNAVIYARVSSEKQEKQETIQSQIAELRKFAKEKGYVIVDEYFDEGYSGEMLARPHLDRMRDHAREKLFQTVLIYSPDRLSRKYVYQELLKMELKKYGVEIIFINNPEKHDKPEDRLLEGIQGLIAEYEKAQIIDRTRRGRLYKARKGILISSIGPYGYKYVKKNVDGKKDGCYLIEENEAIVVRLIFNLFVSKRMSKRALARELTKREIKPRKGIHWRTSTLDKILRNETYTGMAYYNKHIAMEPEKERKRKDDSPVYRRRRNSSLRVRPKEEWIPIKLDEHLRIIDDDLFNMAKELLKKNAMVLPREGKREYLLKGLVECGKCGSPYVGSPCHGKLYYRCGNRYRKFPEKKDCNAGSVSAGKLEIVVWEAVREALQKPELVIEEIKRFHDGVHEQAGRLEQEIKGIEHALMTLKQARDKLLDAYSEDIISKADLKEQMEKSREKEGFLACQRRKLVEQLSNVLSPTEIEKSIHQYCDAVKPRLDSLTEQEKRQILTLLVRRIILEIDGLVRIKAIIPIRQDVSSQEPARLDSERIVNTSSGHCVRPPLRSPVRA